MDIRNITSEPPVIEDDKYLEEIYELQKSLMQGYIGKIEKDLPSYPISINSEKGQLVLKDFSARVIEETAEGYESTSEAIKIADKYGWNMDNISLEDFDMLLNHLQNSNEEQADAFAFFVELMLYANIQPEDIYEYAKKKIVPSTEAVSSYNLNILFNIGYHLQNRSTDIVAHRYLFPLLSDSIMESNGLNPEEISHVNSYIPGFKDMNPNLHEIEDHLLWRVAYHLNIGRNFLKNKTWKQTQELTDIVRYQEQVVLAFINYCGYLQMMGFKPDTFYVLFYKKHMVNEFRQKSNY